MKNQYVGDVNDYRKYGLLRVVLAVWPVTVLVAWMLTADDGGRDGTLREYLRQPERWRHSDPDLFDGLQSLLQRAAAPAVSLIEGSGLLPGASFYSIEVPDRRLGRDAWREGLLASAKDVDLVFLDPDNGVEVPSKPVGHIGSSKYVTWDEVAGLWDIGCSVLIYQHFPREPRDVFARRIVGKLRDMTGARLVEAFETAHVLFLLALQDRHAPMFDRAVVLLAKRWAGEIRPLGLAQGDSV
jgi:hypothetical protein